MASNLLGTGQALDLVPYIYKDFRLLYDEMGVMKSCATKMTLERNTGPSKYIVNYDRVVAADLGDDEDLNNPQDLSDTATTVTPGEVGLQVILAGSTVRRAPDSDLTGRVGTMLANAYDLKEDADGCTQLASFSAGTIGAAGDIAGPGHIRAARAILRIGGSRATPEPFPGPFFTVLHPLQLNIIEGRVVPFTDVPTGTNDYDGTGNTGDTIGAGSNSMSERIVMGGPGAIGQLAGTTVKSDANISVDSSDDAVGGMFAKSGIIHITEVEPKLDPDDSDKSRRGAVEMNLWGSYGWQLYRPAASGATLTFDASIPSS